MNIAKVVPMRSRRTIYLNKAIETIVITEFAHEGQQIIRIMGYETTDWLPVLCDEMKNCLNSLSLRHRYLFY